MLSRPGRAWIFVGAVGLVLALFGQIDLLHPVAAAAVTVASSVALALLAHGGVPLATEAVAFGASGALAYEAARPYVPLVASGLLLAFVFGTRAMRSKSWRELLLHVAVAFAGGVGASWVARANAGLEVTLWMTAVVVAALLASVPWIVPSDAPRTFALRRLAWRAKGPLRWRILRAVVVHRRLGDAELAPRLRRRVERSFDDVILRCERRFDRRASDPMDASVSSAVAQLTRVARAAASRELLLEGLDKTGSELAADSDALEAEVAALSELA
jgi:hypothetical protein